MLTVMLLAGLCAFGLVCDILDGLNLLKPNTSATANVSVNIPATQSCMVLTYLIHVMLCDTDIRLIAIICFSLD